MTWWMWLILIFVVIGMFSNNDNEEKEKQKKEKEDMIKRRKDAEDFIMKSGDEEAIKTLMLAQANPANYAQTLSGGMNKGNDIIKTALGVMTGVAAGNLISTAITASAISTALEDMESDLASLGDDFDADIDFDGDDFDLFS